ncbi:MAG: hypothetical protein WD708_04355 [Kiritimatiellia bacterium]
MGDLLPPSGGYRNLKTFRLARLVYDINPKTLATPVPFRRKSENEPLMNAD